MSEHKNKYIEHLKEKGYKQLTSTLFETNDGFLFQYVEKTEVFNYRPRKSKYLIMIGKDRKIDSKWCNRDCQFLCKKKDDLDVDVCGYCTIRDMNRYIGLTEDIDNKNCECVANGIMITLD